MGAKNTKDKETVLEMEVQVLKWVKVTGTQDEPHKIMVATEVAAEHGVPRQTMKDYIEREVEESQACWSLPFTLLLVVSYFVVSLTHDDASMLRAAEQSMEHDIIENANFAFTGPAMGHKDIHDVNSAADFWSWMSNGLIPLIFVQERNWHEEYNESDGWYSNHSDFAYDDIGKWLKYSRIVGGMRIRQERSANIECPSVKNNLKVYDLECVGGLGYELDPEIRNARFTQDPVREVWLYVYDNGDNLQDVLWEMERTRWLDRYTREVEIAIPVYNGELGIHSMFYIGFFFSRGGHIWKKMMPMSITAQLHQYWYYWIGDFVWMFCVFYIFISEIVDIYRLLRRKGWQALLDEYLTFWNAFDWFSLVCAFAVMGMFGSVMNMINICNDSVDGLLDPRVVAWNSTAYVERLHEHMDTLETTVKYVNNFRTVMAAYPLIIILRLFKAYSAQPRLAMVTKTLETAGQELLEFGLVFFSVFITFTISGVILFGREVVSFGTLPRALFAVFRMLIGDLMWDETSQVGRLFAFMWICLFMLVNVMLLLNMLLAIIMKHYVQAKYQAGNAETLWAEAYQVYRRWRDERAGLSVSIDKILFVLEQEHKLLKQQALLEDEEDVHIEDEDEIALQELGPVITASDLVKAYAHFSKNGGEVREEQILQLMKDATEDYYHQHHAPLNMEEVLKMTHKVEHRCVKLNKMSKMLDRKAVCRNELESTGDFLKEVETFTDELRAECKTHKHEVEELRTLKRGLLLQLQTRQSLDPAAQRLAHEDPTMVSHLFANGDYCQYDWKLGSRFVGDGAREHSHRAHGNAGIIVDTRSGHGIGDTEISLDFDDGLTGPKAGSRQPRMGMEDAFSDDELSGGLRRGATETESTI